MVRLTDKQEILEYLRYRRDQYKEFLELCEEQEHRSEEDAVYKMLNQTHWELKRIIQVIEESETICRICGDEFDSPKGLNSHMSSHSRTKRRKARLQNLVDAKEKSDGVEDQ